MGALQFNEEELGWIKPVKSGFQVIKVGNYGEM